MLRRWMRRIVIAAVIAVSLVALVPGAASAKGARDATITGPNLAVPVRVSCCQAPVVGPAAESHREGNPNELAEATGLAYAAFRVWPTPMVQQRPAGPLGTRYRVTFNYYTGVDRVTPLRQDVYPSAQAGFVTHTPRGQQLFDKRVRSGWYVATPQPNGGGMTTADARALLAALTSPKQESPAPA